MKRKIGRPKVLQENITAVDRIRRSRAARAAIGAVRIDLTVSDEVHGMLRRLVMFWKCRNRKEAIERAIRHAVTVIDQ